MIKMGVDPDNKSRYIKLAKNTIIASVLITLSLTLLEIPKDYFGSPIGIADETTSDITFAKIEDKDCQGREVVNIDGKRYVVTDTGMKLGALTDNDSLDNVTTMGFYDTGKVVENVSFLRLFSECQGTFKGYFADISYYRDAEGFIFPTYFTYPQYTAYTLWFVLSCYCGNYYLQYQSANLQTGQFLVVCRMICKLLVCF